MAGKKKENWNNEASFWSLVDRRGEDDCWPWKGSKTKLKYGQFCLNGKVRYTHRLALLFSGVDIEGFVIRHSCDNPPCCNPKHLTAGTQLENIQDISDRKRWNPTRLENQPFSKLNCQAVHEIRTATLFGVGAYKLAKIFGVKPQTVQNVIWGKTWVA